jgi:hypothetical protein
VVLVVEVEIKEEVKLVQLDHHLKEIMVEMALLM